MKRLTERRGRNPALGYYSPHKKGELIEKLALYENLGFEPEELNQLLENRVNEDTSGLHVYNHWGSWHTIGHAKVGGKDYWLMEHDELGDETAAIIVDSRGKLILDEVWDGFSDEAAEEILEIQKAGEDNGQN